MCIMTELLFAYFGYNIMIIGVTKCKARVLYITLHVYLLYIFYFK